MYIIIYEPVSEGSCNLDVKKRKKNVCVYKSYRVSLTLSVLLILLHLLFNVYTYAHTNLNNIKVIESATAETSE